MKLVPYQPQHYLDAVQALRRPAAFVGIDLATVAQGMTAGPATSAFLDGHLLACAGIMIPWPGRGIAWAIITPRGRAHGVVVHRGVLRGLRALIASHRLRRIEAEVVASYDGGRRWLERLGFQEECVMPLWGPQGETFIRYVLFPKETP